ncbi:MAG TPA: ABC transporter substrate-binding protein [Pseudolabrys sp.]|jgi:NitT/TauT family transport system substrate-binding protein
MVLRALAIISLIAAHSVAASAQERVTVGTMRLTANGALFLAAAQGYFKAEGLDVQLTAYQSEKEVADALAAGATEFGVASFTPAAFNYAGRGLIKIIAAQVREKTDSEGNEIVVSDAAFARGVRKFEDLAKTSVAITQLGSQFHYQLGQIARVKQFDFASMTLKPMQTYDAMARAVGTGQADVAILPGPYARELLVAAPVKLIGWYSQIDQQQLGALFASATAIETKRAVVEKFVRAYQRGAADYWTMVRVDLHGKRFANAKTREMATIIARYVYPGQPIGSAAATVEAGAYYMDPQARLEFADIERQVEWYKAQGLIDRTVDAKEIVDESFVK